MEALRKPAGFALSIALIASAWVYLLWFMKSGFHGYEALVFLGFGVGVFGWLVAGPFGRGIKSLIGEYRPITLPEPSAEFYDLQDQVQALSLEMQRMQELEDRLDFAERLLTQQADTVSGSES